MAQMECYSVKTDLGDDSVLLEFLGFLEQQMSRYPELIELADSAQLQRIGKLIAGVETAKC
jgi:antitoxin PrlF